MHLIVQNTHWVDGSYKGNLYTLDMCNQTLSLHLIFFRQETCTLYLQSYHTVKNSCLQISLQMSSLVRETVLCVWFWNQTPGEPQREVKEKCGSMRFILKSGVRVAFETGIDLALKCINLMWSQNVLMTSKRGQRKKPHKWTLNNEHCSATRFPKEPETFKRVYWSSLNQI